MIEMLHGDDGPSIFLIFCRDGLTGWHVPGPFPRWWRFSVVAIDVATLAGALKQRRLIPIAFVLQLLRRPLVAVAAQFVESLLPVPQARPSGHPSLSQIS